MTNINVDHTVCLSPTWSLGQIFCSPVTKKLLLHKFQLDEERVVGITSYSAKGQHDDDYIQTELPVGESSLVWLDYTKTVSMSVTVIDANHCPGAVMYLFQGYFGSILCTGDFRSIIVSNPQTISLLEP